MTENRTTSPDDTPYVDHPSLERKLPRPFPCADDPSQMTPDEYKSGRIACQDCDVLIPFRDQHGAFTGRYWNSHKAKNGSCVPYTSEDDSPRMTIVYAHDVGKNDSPSTLKRRRAKRSEDERIAYLQADEFIAEFEAYRVLCASCDKWIRLRPNSTYCSIPWDAHRKSCLSKKSSGKGVYAIEERDSLFSKDVDIREFDTERILCGICHCWLNINPDDHLQAIQKWLQHRTSCKKTSSSPASNSSGNRITILRKHGSEGDDAHLEPPAPGDVPSPSPASSPSRPTSRNGSPSDCPPPFDNQTTSSFGRVHESRRRSAEQRAHKLSADPLIRHVEPNRVFCSLCQKWVQLRQDSSFCAYPWQQHRGKCLARHQRRTEKAVFLDEREPQQHVILPRKEVLSDDSDRPLDNPRRSSIDTTRPDPVAPFPPHSSYANPHRVQSQSRSFPPAGPAPQTYVHQPQPNLSRAATSASASSSSKSPPRLAPRQPQNVSGPLFTSSKPLYDRSAITSSARNHEQYDRDSRSHDPKNSVPVFGGGHNASADERDRSRGRSREVADDKPVMLHHSHPQVQQSHVRQQQQIAVKSVTDLKSLNGRRQFLFTAVEFLFQTSYDYATDDVTISTLLGYLNSALPVDKYEEFDTREVVKGVGALCECTGRFVLEGDTLRVVT